MSHLIRKFHPYWKWEEVRHNMWGKVKQRNTYLSMAVIFTGNADLYGEWMRKVVDEWRFSCEHNLSNKEQNRKAWIGHAACALFFKCPEDVVREAWSHLSEDQQLAANNKAQEAIEYWEKKYAKD